TAAHLHYRVAKVQSEADMEFPPTLGFDIRLTQRDAIFTRRGIKITKGRSGHFRSVLHIATGAGNVRDTRGWAWVDGRIRGRNFRFITSHLEAYSDSVRRAQADDLGSRGGVVRTAKRAILAADLNSAPAGVGA